MTARERAAARWNNREPPPAPPPPSPRPRPVQRAEGNRSSDSDDDPALLDAWRADLESRSGSPGDDFDAHDKQRCVLVRALLSQGRVATPSDYYRAAAILHHGGSAIDCEKAHALSLAALDMGNEDARWLAAATYDRLLIGLGYRQHFGTQTLDVDGRAVVFEYDEDVTDVERSWWDVPPIAHLHDRATSSAVTIDDVDS